MEDVDLLVESLRNLKECTDLETLYMDGGYSSPDVDQNLLDQQIEATVW
jgi:hypothetical protein